MKRATLFILLLLLLCSLPLVACEGPQPATPVAPAGQGGTLDLYGIDPIMLDPAVAGDATSHEYIVQVFGGLVRLGNDLEPAPDIAERWDVSTDGRTYVFYLRQDVTFHDGRGVTAEDFKYSWERACDPATGSRTAATYLGDIVGVGDVLAGRAGEISGLRVIGDYELEVTIDSPKSYFLSKLTYPTACVVDRDNVKSGTRWWRQPNGTGPFMLSEWKENESLVLVRNDAYHGDVARLDSVEFHLWSGVPIRMYEMDEIDVAAVSVIDIDRVTDEAGPFASQLRVTPELSFTYIGFDATRPPFDDANVRRAFTQAVDKDRIVSLVFRDLVENAEGILPPGIPGFNEALDGLAFDPAAAKASIAASSYGSVEALPLITITTSGYGGSISSALEAIIHEWRTNLGVEVEVRQLEPERFLYNLREEKDDMYIMGWIADYPHPQDFLDILFRSGEENNFGGYASSEVDDLLDRAAAGADYDAGLELYRQAEQLLVDDAACLPLWFGQNYTLVKPYVDGYELSPMGFAMLNGVGIEE